MIASRFPHVGKSGRLDNLEKRLVYEDVLRFSLYHVVPVLPHVTGQTEYVNMVILLDVLE